MKGTVKSDMADIILNWKRSTVQKQTVTYARKNNSHVPTPKERPSGHWFRFDKSRGIFSDNGWSTLIALTLQGLTGQNPNTEIKRLKS